MPLLSSPPPPPPQAPHTGVVGGGDRGAGLHFTALRASHRLKDMYLMHDDDEVEDLLKQWGSFTSPQVVVPLPSLTTPTSPTLPRPISPPVSPILSPLLPSLLS